MTTAESNLPMKRHLSARELEQLQEIVIRAHYLAMELRDLCAPSGVAEPSMSHAVSGMLKSWALSFGASLRQSEEANAHAFTSFEGGVSHARTS